VFVCVQSKEGGIVENVGSNETRVRKANVLLRSLGIPFAFLRYLARLSREEPAWMCSAREGHHPITRGIYVRGLR